VANGHSSGPRVTAGICATVPEGWLREERPGLPACAGKEAPYLVLLRMGFAALPALAASG